MSYAHLPSFVEQVARAQAGLDDATTRRFHGKMMQTARYVYRLDWGATFLRAGTMPPLGELRAIGFIAACAALIEGASVSEAEVAGMHALSKAAYELGKVPRRWGTGVDDQTQEPYEWPNSEWAVVFRGDEAGLEDKSPLVQLTAVEDDTSMIDDGVILTVEDYIDRLRPLLTSAQLEAVVAHANGESTTAHGHVLGGLKRRLNHRPELAEALRSALRTEE